MATMGIPYGISDFQLISMNNYYYVDKTRFIEEVERAPRFLFLIRPRRFGKSLWLATLESYYDVAMRDRFDELFGKYYIGQHPTEERNSYLILKFNFAMVNLDPEELEQSFEGHVANCIDDFNARYKHLLGERYLEGCAKMASAASRLEYVALHCGQAGLPIYLIIDSYDKFTNVVFSRQGEERNRALERNAAFFCYFFKVVKDVASGTGAAVRRMFIVGETPVTLDDVTSGFNIAKMITTDAQFGEVLGFTEEEVRGMLAYYKGEGRWSGDAEEVLGVMREWYGNYCFSDSGFGARVYNPEMVLYFVNALVLNGAMPDAPDGGNVALSYRKFRHFVVPRERLGENFAQTWRVAKEGEVAATIERGFPAEEMLDERYFISLLYHFGLLTIDRVERGKTVLRVPNLTIRRMLFSYIVHGFKAAGVFEADTVRLQKLMSRMAYDGEWRGVFEYFAEELREQTSVRDYLEGEKAVQTLHLVYMNLTDYFVIWPEREMNKGYADLWMSPNLLRHPEMRYSYVVEFKYLKHDASDGEVAAKLEEARGQLRQYAGEGKAEASAGGTTVRYIAVVYRAWELAALEEVGR